MLVLGDDLLGLGGDGAVGEFVIVWVAGDETPAEMRSDAAQIVAPSPDKKHDASLFVAMCCVGDRVANGAD